jgi:hypothetical protein
MDDTALEIAATIYSVQAATIGLLALAGGVWLLWRAVRLYSGFRHHLLQP